MRKRRRGWEETQKLSGKKRRWWWRERMRDLPKTCLKGCCSFSFRRSRKTREEAEEFNFLSHRIYSNYLWGLCSDGRSFSTKKVGVNHVWVSSQEMREEDDEGDVRRPHHLWGNSKKLSLCLRFSSSSSLSRVFRCKDTVEGRREKDQQQMSRCLYLWKKTLNIILHHTSYFSLKLQTLGGVSRFCFTARILFKKNYSLHGFKFGWRGKEEQKQAPDDEATGRHIRDQEIREAGKKEPRRADWSLASLFDFQHFIPLTGRDVTGDKKVSNMHLSSLSFFFFF